jgi:hypothetical protein
MRTFLTTICLLNLVTFIAAQEIKEWDFSELKTKTANSAGVIFDEDGTIGIIIEDYLYHYDQDGELLDEPKQVSGLYSSQNPYYQGARAWNDKTQSLVQYDYAYDTKRKTRTDFFKVEKFTIGDGKSTQDYHFDDTLTVFSKVWKGFDGASTDDDYVYQKPDGSLVSAEVYLTTSKESHPLIKKPKNRQYYSFVHLIQYDPENKTSKITNNLIDKVTTEKTENSMVHAKIVGVVNNKLIVLFSAYKVSRVATLLREAERTLTFWSIDLETGEEKMIYEGQTSFPENMANYSITQQILTDQNTLITDLSWTEPKKMEGPAGKYAYSSHHKFLIMDSDFQFREERIDVPTDVLLLAENGAGRFIYHINDENELFYCMQAATKSTRKIESSYYLYMFSVDENDKVISAVKNSASGIGSPDGIEVFIVKDFTEEELEKMYGEIFVNEDYCKLCPSHLYNYAKIIDNSIVTVTLHFLTEHTCAAKCEVEKMMVRITKTELDK